MDWRARLGSKLVSLEQAVGLVRSGHTISVSPFTATPVTLCEGLKARTRAKGNLENVRVMHMAALVSWTEPEFRNVFKLIDNYATPANRAACNSGDSEYLPIASGAATSFQPACRPR